MTQLTAQNLHTATEL